MSAAPRNAAFPGRAGQSSRGRAAPCFIIALLALPLAAAAPEFPPSNAEYAPLDTGFFHHWVGTEGDARRFLSPGDGSAIWVAAYRDPQQGAEEEVRFVARATSRGLVIESAEVRVPISGSSGGPDRAPSPEYAFLELPFGAPSFGHHAYTVDVEVWVTTRGVETRVASGSAEGEFWESPVPTWAFVVLAAALILAIPAIGIWRRRARPQ